MTEYTSIIYIEVERTIDFYFQMQQTEKELELVMTTESIRSANHSFLLQHVHDMSFKPFSFGGGFLYLHTNQGVFTYKINVNPTFFVDVYKNLKQNFMNHGTFYKPL